MQIKFKFCQLIAQLLWAIITVTSVQALGGVDVTETRLVHYMNSNFKSKL